MKKIVALCLVALAAAGVARGQSTAADSVELERTRSLVDAGALPRQALEDAMESAEETRLRETLLRTLLRSDLDLTKITEMVQAAERLRVLARKRFVRRSALLEAGAIAAKEMQGEKERLDLAERQYELAEKKAALLREMAAIASAEERWDELEDEELAFGYVGEGESADPGVWAEDLFFLEAAFADQFGIPLPVSANGDTALHRSMGFDHTSRIDLDLHPDDEMGRFVLDMLETWGVPYLAFRSAVPGQSTGPHIHIGLPSLRIPSASAIDAEIIP